MSGRHLAGVPFTIEERQAEINELYTKLSPQRTSSEVPAEFPPLSDEKVLAKARQSARFKQLYGRGDLRGHHGDWSAADLSLAKLLAIFTGRNVEQVERLFRQSALMRPKWNAFRGDSTYGTTNDRACHSEVRDSRARSALALVRVGLR